LKRNDLIKLIGIPAFIWILYSLDLKRLFDSLQSIDISYLIFVILIFFPIILLKTLRWSAILKSRGITLPLSGLYSAYMSSFSAGGVTPGRFGDMLKFSYVRDAGYGLGISLSSAFSDRLWDAVLLLVLGLFGLPFIYPLSSGQNIVNTAFMLFMVFLIFVVILYKKPVYRLLSKLISQFIPEKYSNKLEGEGKDFFYMLLPKDFWEFSKLLLLTLASWILYFYGYYILSKALGLNVDFLILSLILSLTALLSFIPVTISGIGTRDAALIVLLKPYGVYAEEAVAFSLSILAIFLIDIVIGFLFSLSNPIKKVNNDSI